LKALALRGADFEGPTLKALALRGADFEGPTLKALGAVKYTV
jgi:uncharacterized protein YjbI with pentapeptide repeats